MSWQTLRPQIKTLLEEIQSGGINIFQEVSGTPRFKFNGYPSAYVVQSDNESNYNTTSENARVYAFLVRIFYSTKKVGVATGLERLEEIVDAILDDIDQDAYKSSDSRVIGIGMPAGYTWVNTFAAPSIFGEVEGEELVMAELNIKIKVIRDIT